MKAIHFFSKRILQSVFILLMSLVCMNVQETQAQYTFGYKDIPLTWRNFTKKEIHSKSKAAALTAVKANLNYEVIGDELTITIELNQSKKNSWVSKQFLRRATDEESVNLLQHEQLHYAIHLIGFGNLYKDLSTGNYTKNYESEITSYFAKYQQYTHQSNRDYDNETQNGRNLEKQKDWEKVIFITLNKVYLGSENIPSRYVIKKKITP